MPVWPFCVCSKYAATFLCFQNFLLSLLMLKEHRNGQILCLFLCVNRFETVTHQNKLLFCNAFKQQPLYTNVNPFERASSAGVLPRLCHAIGLAYEILCLKHTVHVLFVLMVVFCLATYFVHVFSFSLFVPVPFVTTSLVCFHIWVLVL